MVTKSKSEAKVITKVIKSLPKLPKIPAKGLKVSKTVTVTKKSMKPLSKITVKVKPTSIVNCTCPKCGMLMKITKKNIKK